MNAGRDADRNWSAGGARDEGFTLIEVIVAFGLFVALVSASMVLLSTTQRTARDNTYRTTALNLAARELAITSDSFNSLLRGPESIEINQVVNANPLSGGTVGQPLKVNNVSYTVKRVAQWAAVGSSAASTCDDGTAQELAYLRVHVEVSWPGAEDRPAEMDTVLTPLKGTYSVNDGHIGVKVIDRDGLPGRGSRSRSPGRPAHGPRRRLRTDASSSPSSPPGATR
ncbi:type IV pilus modification PilV family protein [Nocardioides sambongensis]|uniref:type IV pilus modification PilV family protein n=1 Tax=Nocardioides sambongensis TaxID=2589074 RepID=UPI0011286142|nr:prepilin-type N-terminal cleavage/methylation domain-containing protein [Nocardioides sambongensis]